MSNCVSIIICTRNRAAHLRQTLEAFAAVAVPPTLTAELIIADNGSTDSTQAVIEDVVREGRLPHFAVRAVSAPTPGQCQARNAGLAAARGEILLFTDDDVRPPADWIAGMCGPILGGEADAVAGGVVIAPHLERDWMTKEHRNWLASTEAIPQEELPRMVGANMAFSRRVLEKVPGFDLELGPGALGFDDDTLFTWQLLEADYKVELALDVCVEHHFEASRLKRKNFIDSARKMGSSWAYVVHHWQHDAPPATFRGYLRAVRQLLSWRFNNARSLREAQGIAEAEMYLLQKYWEVSHSLLEQRKPRKYAKHGLIKLR